MSQIEISLILLLLLVSLIGIPCCSLCCCRNSDYITLTNESN